MNYKSYLLVQFASECAEVAHATSKMIQFGPDDKVTKDPEGPRGTEGPTCAEKVTEEFVQLLGVYEMLVRENLVEDIGLYKLHNHIRLAMLKKSLRVEAYSKYAARVHELEL